MPSTSWQPNFDADEYEKDAWPFEGIDCDGEDDPRLHDNFEKMRPEDEEPNDG